LYLEARGAAGLFAAFLRHMRRIAQLAALSITVALRPSGEDYN
jgi:hypothetical protein